MPTCEDVAVERAPWGTLACDEFERAADRLFDLIIERAGERDRLYDEATAHGWAQGVELRAVEAGPSHPVARPSS